MCKATQFAAYLKVGSSAELRYALDLHLLVAEF